MNRFLVVPGYLGGLLLWFLVMVALTGCTGCNRDLTICGPYLGVPWLPS